MTKVLVDKKELQELFDSIMGNYYQGQPTEQRLIHNLMSNAKDADKVGAQPCGICFETEPHTGTCGSSDPKALCNKPDQPASGEDV